MNHNDFTNRFLFDETDIRGEITAMESSFQNAFAHQTIPDELIPVFGEFLAGAALLSEVLKFEGILTLQARGDGDVAIIMAETNDKGHLRGILRVNPDLDLDQASFDDRSLSSLLGNGALTITIDPSKGKRYQGIVPLSDGDLAHCLEDYFQQSEQLPTQIQLFANKTHCGGLFLQYLPAQIVLDEDTRKDNWETCTQLAATVSGEELFSLSNEEVLLRLFHEMTCRVFSPKPLVFNCTCDRERSSNALQSLGYDDAHALLQEQDMIIIDCQFCGKKYTFGAKDLVDIFPGRGQPIH